MTDAVIRNALIDSYNNYAIGVDTKTWPLVKRCFTDEVSLDYGELNDSTGGSNVLSSNADSAVCIAYLDADHIIFSDSGINITTPLDAVKLVGEYSDEYRLIDGLWKIVKSHLRTDWM